MAYRMIMTEEGKAMKRVSFPHGAKITEKSRFTTKDKHEYARMLDGSIRRLTKKKGEQQ